MPRRAPCLREEVPLFALPSVLKKEIRNAGEELIRIVVKKAGRHFYNISIHTSSIKRELWHLEPVFAGPSCRRKVRA